MRRRIMPRYHFELVLTTPIRRFKDYQKGLFDSVFFENPNWGWQQGNNVISNSPVIAIDTEVFIALKQFAKSQAWFLAVFMASWSLLWFIPLVGYGFAWVGHFFFEKNRPATFKHPLYSLMGDWVMFKDILVGKISLKGE